MKRKFGKVFSRIYTIVYIPMIFLLVLTTVSSCSSHSVRDVKEGTSKNKKRKNKPTSKASFIDNSDLIKSLFMQTGRIEVNMPDLKGMEVDSVGRVVVDQDLVLANYANRGTTTSSDNAAEGDSLSTLPNETLGGFVGGDLTNTLSISPRKYAAERQGKVNTGFVLRVPQAFISSKWRLTVSPKVVYNDSVISLKNVVLRGQEFANRQAQDYQDYEEYVNSIVGTDDYDEHFLDHKGLRKDMSERQRLYFDKYHKEWSKQVAYEEWRDEREEYITYYMAKEIGYRAKVKHSYIRKAREDVMKRLVAKKDTTGVYAKYERAFEKKAKKLRANFARPEIQLKEVPEKYRENFLANLSVDDVRNIVMTPQDSILIAKHRYKYDEIAANEFKKTTKDDIISDMIPFQYEEKDKVRIDSIVQEGQDFLYYYSNEFKMPEGSGDLRLTVESKINGMDRSTYNFPKRDTLSYQVSALSDLIDYSLTIKRVQIYRNMFASLTIYPKFMSEKTDFKLNFEDNQEQIQKVVDMYNRYTVERGFVMDSVSMKSSTSLDGSWSFNAKLSKLRSEAVKAHLSRVLPSNSDVENVFVARHIGEDWNTLAKMIVDRDDMPNRDKILDIIKTATDPDLTEREIRKAYRTDYRIMKDSLYPKLRKMEFTFNFRRPNMEVTDSIQENVLPGYEEGLTLLKERKYWDAIELLSEYPDYNTALCMAAMGLDEKAYSLLTQLPVTGNTEYLLAIVTYRLGYENDAVEHLHKACELDPTKKDRVALDPEIAKLIEKYNL